jgi:hypothetical protein
MMMMMMLLMMLIMMNIITVTMTMKYAYFGYLCEQFWRGDPHHFDPPIPVSG